MTSSLLVAMVLGVASAVVPTAIAQHLLRRGRPGHAPVAPQRSPTAPARSPRPSANSDVLDIHQH